MSSGTTQQISCREIMAMSLTGAMYAQFLSVWFRYHTVQMRGVIILILTSLVIIGLSAVLVNWRPQLTVSGHIMASMTLAAGAVLAILVPHTVADMFVERPTTINPRTADDQVLYCMYECTGHPVLRIGGALGTGK